MNFSLKKPLPSFFDRGDTPTKPLMAFVFFTSRPYYPVRASMAAILSICQNKNIACLYALLGGNAFVFFIENL